MADQWLKPVFVQKQWQPDGSFSEHMIGGKRLEENANKALIGAVAVGGQIFPFTRN